MSVSSRQVKNVGTPKPPKAAMNRRTPKLIITRAPAAKAAGAKGKKEEGKG
jgi:hypothetical protein